MATDGIDIDELICLGDSIYEYRFSNEVVRLLREREALVILGNHEEGFFVRPGSGPVPGRTSTGPCSTGSPGRPHRLA